MEMQKTQNRQTTLNSIPQNRKQRLLDQLRPIPEASTVLFPLCSIGQRNYGARSDSRGWRNRFYLFMGEQQGPTAEYIGRGIELWSFLENIMALTISMHTGPPSKCLAPETLCLRSSLRPRVCLLWGRSATMKS